jgi:hypothetical protein
MVVIGNEWPGVVSDLAIVLDDWMDRDKVAKRDKLIIVPFNVCLVYCKVTSHGCHESGEAEHI